MRLPLAWLASVALLGAAHVPSGSHLELRFTTAVNTSKSQVGDSFHAVVIAPVVVDGRIAIAAGVNVSGRVKEVTAAVQPDDQAILALVFDQLSDSFGKTAKMEARLVGVDNARESVDKDGRILGIIASKTGSGRLDQGINKVSERYQGLGELLGAIKQSVLKDANANIDFEPGVDFTIELTRALDWTGDSRGASVGTIDPQAQLAALVNEQPFRTMAVKPAKESDLTNLMFLGTAEQIQKAFESAGWATADTLNAKSKLETFRAMTEQRGYKEAPVSVLMLDGRAPDMVFQKETDTFNARHHLRIWQRPGRFEGKQIWVCSATHDTGIDFSEENRTFIHKVDGQIDRERAKVVNDLLFTGLVRGLSLVDRPDVPTSLMNATGDKIETDGRMAVIAF